MSVGPDNKKQYGLIIPNSKEPVPKKKPVSSVFNCDSSDEETTDSAQPTHLKSGAFKGMKRQARIDIQAAMEEDPTVYQYDELYDEMKDTKEKAIAEKKVDKTSKYAKKLMRNAALRKLENDKHFERKCAREIEEEGDEFADKEAFITSSYKAKLAELAVLEAEHKRMEEEEAKNDVTKKNDLSAFYRNILDKRTEVRTVAAKISQESKDLDSVLKGEAPEIKEEPVEEDAPAEKRDVEKDMKQEAKKAIAKARSYRKKSTEQAGGSKTDDESGDYTPDEDEAVKKVKKEVVEGDEDDKDDSDSSDDEKYSKDNKDKDNKEKKDKDENVDKDDSSSDEDVKPAVEVKPKLLLTVEEEREERLKMVKAQFTMRNTEETIDDAKKRYFQRLSAKAG